MIEGDLFDIKPAYFALARSLAALLRDAYQLHREARLVIGIAGESGSGKSVTATCLARELESGGLRTCVIHQDNYFHRPPRTNHEHRVGDLRHVGPHEVNLELLRSHIGDFRARRDNVSAPLVDYPGNRFVTQQFDFGTCGALIVEGTYILNLGNIDVRIFLEATHEEAHERRRVRNRDIDAPVIDEILALEHRLIAPQAQLADIVIDRHFAISART